MFLTLPIKDICVTQPLGMNYLDFYKNLGMKGHNGIDFKAGMGCKVLSAHDGIVSYCSIYNDGEDNNPREKWMRHLEIQSLDKTFKTVYLHLLRFESNIQPGIKVNAGQVIGRADNTGKYTTGNHLHFGMKMIDVNGNTINYDNGYMGAIDPTPYFVEKYGKDWFRSASYNRYGRKQDWMAEWKMRFKNPWLHRQLMKRGMNPIWGIEPINALVYGEWDFESVINPALYESWGYLTKREFLSGKRAFK